MNKSAARRWVRANCDFAKIADAELAVDIVRTSALKNSVKLSEEDILKVAIRLMVYASLADKEAAGAAEWLQKMWNSVRQQPQVNPIEALAKAGINLNNMIDTEVGKLVSSGRMTLENQSQWFNFVQEISLNINEMLSKLNSQRAQNGESVISGTLMQAQPLIPQEVTKFLVALRKSPQGINKYIVAPPKPQQPPEETGGPEDINWQG